MTIHDQWTTAGTEPRLSEMLSDQVTRDLMRADGVDVSEVNAVVDRMRHCVRPIQFAPAPQSRPGAAAAKTAKFGRILPIHAADQATNMQVASEVINRWIAAIAGAKRIDLD